MKFKIEELEYQKRAIQSTIEAIREGRKKIDIEMETGTGKTFTFISTIFESYKTFGANKFIIVVPRIAIKEGVYKSFKIFENYFKEKYPEILYDVYNYSGNRKNISSFIYNGGLQILILTPHSFNKKDVNILTSETRDDLFGKESLMKQIAKLNPYLIIDETHITGGKTTKEALFDLKPKITLGYSATPLNKANIVYSFSATEAYLQRQVKRLEYWNFEFENKVNLGFTLSDFNPVSKTAKALLNKKAKTIKVGSEIEGFKVKIITKDDVFFEGGLKYSDLKKASLKETEMLKIQIRETIREHLRKSRELRQKGIKVLSLFFVPSVSEFLGSENAKGIIWQTFLEEYQMLASEDAKDKLAYYFSIKKGLTENEKEKEMTDLILKQREELLSLSNPVEFIFAHTALSTGWDNPNIFQICFLRNITSEVSRKQSIGRGLRLCVNEKGERIYDGMEVADSERINNLTIIANEHYEKFCKEYQKESGFTAESKAENPIKKQASKTTIKARKEKLEQLRELYIKLKAKTRWFVSFGNLQEFYSNLTRELSNLEVAKGIVTKTAAEITTGISTGYELIEEIKVDYNENKIINKISEETYLTRREAREILQNLEKESIKQNPDLWLEKVINLINKTKEEHLLRACEVRYEPLVGQEFKLEDFYIEERSTSAKTKATEKSIYEQTDVDSGQEEKMINELESENNIEFYIKFQKTGGFHINTPIGTYTPDFGIIVKNSNGKFYLVVETKGDLSSLRDEERFKIKCAIAHFNAIGIESKLGEEFGGILGKAHKIKKNAYNVYNPQ